MPLQTKVLDLYFVFGRIQGIVLRLTHVQLVGCTDVCSSNSEKLIAMAEPIYDGQGEGGVVTSADGLHSSGV